MKKGEKEFNSFTSGFILPFLKLILSFFLPYSCLTSFFYSFFSFHLYFCCNSGHFLPLNLIFIAKTMASKTVHTTPPSFIFLFLHVLEISYNFSCFFCSPFIASLYLYLSIAYTLRHPFICN